MSPTTDDLKTDEAFESAVAAIHTAATALAEDETDHERKGLEDDLLSTAQAFLFRTSTSPIASREQALKILLHEHNKMVQAVMLHVDLIGAIQSGEKRVHADRLRRLSARKLRESLYVAEQAGARLSDDAPALIEAMEERAA